MIVELYSPGTDLKNIWAAASLNYLLPVQIWTNSKVKIKKVFESAVQIH